MHVQHAAEQSWVAVAGCLQPGSNDDCEAAYYLDILGVRRQIVKVALEGLELLMSLLLLTLLIASKQLLLSKTTGNQTFWLPFPTIQLPLHFAV